MKSYLQTILIANSVADGTANYIPVLAPKSPAYAEILIKGSIIVVDEF